LSVSASDPARVLDYQLQHSDQPEQQPVFLEHHNVEYHAWTYNYYTIFYRTSEVIRAVEKTHAETSPRPIAKEQVQEFVYHL
jgi:hypothetical protein